jgi:hypothetical protein
MNNGERCKSLGIKVPEDGYQKVPIVGVKDCMFSIIVYESSV